MIVSDIFRGHELDATLSPLTCAVFAPVLREWVNRRRLEGWRFQAAVWDDLEGIEQIAAAYHAARAAKQAQPRSGVVGPVVGATAKRLSPASVGLVKEVTAAEAAKQLGISKAAVTKRCRGGSLAARRTDRGEWLIRQENLRVSKVGTADA
ncbi:MAG: hypothetical protein JWM85_2227 [Acidimicrobiaceae bacterium]|nr:hypothetical protein [Acidimicrobiaceae bacterium]